MGLRLLPCRARRLPGAQDHREARANGSTQRRRAQRTPPFSHVVNATDSLRHWSASLASSAFIARAGCSDAACSK
eukprot:scaffold46557_cov70-Phaeocystis_antarctica.AAC.8